MLRRRRRIPLFRESRQSVAFEVQAEAIGQTQLALAPPNCHLGLTQLVEVTVHPPIPGRTAHSRCLS